MADNSADKSNSSGLTDPLIGQMLFGEFAVTSLLGTRSGCQVYKARYVTAEGSVAVFTPLMPDPSVVEAFSTAMQQHMALTHKNIVQTVACRRLDNGRPFFITEFVDGISLPDLFAGGTLEKAEDIATVLLQAAAALEFAHERGFYHGDLDPRVVCLCESEGELVVKVSNFGFISCRLLMETLRSGSTGDLDFVAPELIAGEEPSAACDVYSLGAIGVVLAGGCWPPLSSNDPSETSQLDIVQLRAELSEVELLSSVLCKATAFEPSKRFQSIAEFRASLLDWLEKATVKVGAGGFTKSESQIDSAENNQLLIADLKQSVHNIVTLKYKQVAQEENVLLRVCDTLSSQGPRPSPRKLLLRVTAATTCFVLAVALSLWAFTNHGAEIVAAWNEASYNLNKALRPINSEKSVPLASPPKISTASSPISIPPASEATQAASRVKRKFVPAANGLNPSEQWPVEKLLLEVPYNASDGAAYRAKNQP